MRILVVEDDDQIAAFIRSGLTEVGYLVDHCKDGEEGLAMAMEEAYGAIIMDIMLPGIDGLRVVEKMRGSGVITPVLILSAKRSVDDRVRGLQKGGDDYLVKPFAFAELLARIRALTRRVGAGVDINELQVGPLRLDLLKRIALRADQSIQLNTKEFRLLHYLMRNKGFVVSKTMILQEVWEFDFDPQTNVVDVLVHRLRTKIDKGFSHQLIHTVRGLGYVLKE